MKILFKKLKILSFFLFVSEIIRSHPTYTKTEYKSIKNNHNLEMYSI